MENLIDTITSAVEKYTSSKKVYPSDISEIYYLLDYKSIDTIEAIPEAKRNDILSEIFCGK